MGKKVTWIGEPGFESYHGSDGDKGVNIDAGETVIVSDEKAEQMAADFGHLCSIDGGKPSTKPDPVVPAHEPDTETPQEPAMSEEERLAREDAAIEEEAAAKAAAAGDQAPAQEPAAEQTSEKPAAKPPARRGGRAKK